MDMASEGFQNFPDVLVDEEIVQKINKSYKIDQNCTLDSLCAKQLKGMKIENYKECIDILQQNINKNKEHILKFINNLGS